MKCKTTEDFIIDAKKIHGDKYDYSLVDYKNCKERIKIICSIHGDFEQTPDGHLTGRGCFKCSGTIKRTKNEFIEKARMIYGDKYDYSLVEYKNNTTKVKIICSKHNIFEQIPKNHLNGHECPYCYGNNKKTTEEFINESKKINNDKYNYSLTEYNGSNKKIKLICNEHKIIFKINPHNHLFQKYSCPICKGRITRLNKIKIISENKLNGHQLMPAFNKNACYIFDEICKKENNLQSDCYQSDDDCCVEALETRPQSASRIHLLPIKTGLWFYLVVNCKLYGDSRLRIKSYV